jgi:hypothetical protein
MTMRRWLENPKLIRIAILGMLLGLVIFHAANNWRWLTANVTLLGWDVPSHLGTSYIYDGLLRPLTPKTLFAAIAWHPNRPPLYFLSALPLYRLFGLSADVGTMINVLYLAILFGSVYGIGRRLGGRRVGLLATFVIATLPMIYAISRYFYLELALTAFVALSVYLLLASNGFENRALSLLFGLSLGLGLLTKRTYLVFIFAPLCVVVVRSGVLKSLEQRLRTGHRPEIKGVLLALGIGLALAIAWYLPAREIASQLLLGVWLIPLWTILIATTIYLARLTPGPDTNLLSALSLGATLGSLWYLPRITFIQRLLRFGFGVNDPWERSANLDRLGTYIYFLEQLIKEHVSPVFFVLLVVAVLSLLLYLWRSRDVWGTLRRAGDAWWATAFWLVGSYLLLTLSIYRKSRGITPVLPALALILAAGVFKLPWKRVITLLVALIVGWGLLQFVALSFEGPHRLTERITFSLPVLGGSSLFAQGGAHSLPDEAETDRDYWVVPDILQFVDTERKAMGAGQTELGVLVNNEHVNPDLFGLLALQDYPGVQVRNLARSGIADSITTHLFEYDYLVMIEENYKWIDEAARTTLRHLDESPGLFEAAFELAGAYPLPDGDTVLLYHKVQPPETGHDLTDYQVLAERLTALARGSDAILLVPPDQVEMVGRTYDGSSTPYLLPREVPVEPEGTVHMLEEMVSRHPIIFAIFREEQGVDPDRFVEGWLNQNAYRGPTEWYGGMRLVMFGAPQAGTTNTGMDPGEMERPLAIELGDQIRLLGYTLSEESVEPGRMVRLTLFWQTSNPLSERYTVFAHVLDEGGQLVAQQDSEPAGGSRPTNTWSEGEVIADHMGILIPATVASGPYRLIVGMYQPNTGERLPVLDPEGDTASSPPAGGDSITLGTIWVK